VRVDQLEGRVVTDISETLHLFNGLIPDILRGLFAWTAQARELYNNRAQIDFLSVARPTLVGLAGEAADLLRERFCSDVQEERQIRTNNEMAVVVSNIVDGLAEIQVNNMQQQQLLALDAVIKAQVENKQGGLAFASQAHRMISNR
jgi:hypothetical protein